MLRLRLVGEFHVELDGQPLEPIASRRARALLAWLAYHPGMHTRTRVASVFWPDVLESSARASLRTTLSTLRREAGDAVFAHVASDRARVGIPDAPGLWIDVREIARLEREGRYEDALAICDGELLTDLDDDWVLEARQELRDSAGELLVRLGDAADAGGDLEAAVRYARRRLELDPVSEEAVRVLMRRLERTGDGAAAVGVFEAFRSTLARELGMAPSAETRALAEELRAGDARGHGATPPTAPTHGDGATPPTAPTPGHGAMPPAAPPSDSAPPLPAALAGEHPQLVGRRHELAALRAAWRQASAGAAKVVVVHGEAGSGKTRLLIELAREAHAGGATVLAGRCWEDGGLAFAPFTEALRHHAAGLPDWVVTELARLLPELEPAVPPPEGEPQDARHRLFEAVAAAIGHGARRRPLMLVVEDLHWADPATVQMLAHVIRTVAWAPLLVAGSTRDESAPALAALLADLRRERRLERIGLTGLSEDEVGALAAAQPGADAPPPALIAAVHRRTNGNPLFVEEMVRHLVESHPGQSAEALAAAAESDVPDEVRTVIDRRLAHLAEPAGRAVRTAAIVGEDFALADVAAVSEASDDALADWLEGAVTAGLIAESTIPGRYRFAHALVREAVLAGLPATRRALLHRKAAEAIRGEGRAGEVARHLLDARPLVDAAEAARAALRAAEEATRRLAYEDAADVLERAADSDLAAASRPADGDAGHALDDALRAEVLLALGDARQRTGDVPAANRCFAEAGALARSLGDPDRLARAALGTAGLTIAVGPVRDEVRALLEEALAAVADDSPLRPRLLARLAIELYHASPATERERVSDEALTAGRRVGGRALLEALGARRVALWSPDHTEERLAIADELIAESRSQGDREAELQGVNWRVVDLLELGRGAEVQAAIDEHERLAGELRLLAYAWYVPLWRAMLALLAGRLDEAERLSEEGARIGRSAHDANAELLFGVQRRVIRRAQGRTDDRDRAAIARGAEERPPGAAWRTWVAIAALDRGVAEEAARRLKAEVAALPDLPRDSERLYTVTALGALAARLGDAEAAAAVYPYALPYRGRIVTVGRGAVCTGAVSYALGLAAATFGDTAAARAHLEEAARQHDELGAAPLAAACRRALTDPGLDHGGLTLA